MIWYIVLELETSYKLAVNPAYIKNLSDVDAMQISDFSDTKWQLRPAIKMEIFIEKCICIWYVYICLFYRVSYCVYYSIYHVFHAHFALVDN